MSYYRRGLGLTASDYAQLAAKMPATSAAGREFAGCAQNPTPQCDADAAAIFGSGVTPAAQQSSAGPVPVYYSPQALLTPTAATIATSAGNDVATPTFSAPAAAPAVQSRIVSAPWGPIAGSLRAPAVLSPGGATPPGTTATAPAAGFSLSSIPWWGWGIAAVGAYFLFAGGGRGR